MMFARRERESFILSVAMRAYFERAQGGDACWHVLAFIIGASL